MLHNGQTFLAYVANLYLRSGAVRSTRFRLFLFTVRSLQQVRHVHCLKNDRLSIYRYAVFKVVTLCYKRRRHFVMN
jgi:hypothetical protein